MTQKENMLSGQMYLASDPELQAERDRAHEACRRFNADQQPHPASMQELFSHFGAVGDDCLIESPFFCDYGYNLFLGKGVYLNFNVCILDCAPVHLGDGVKLGPGVQLYTAGHALDPERRRAGDEFALPIRVGENVWIGGSSIVLPGVTIGAHAVVGAGSVVTKDVPAGARVVGNPARVLVPRP